VNTPPFLNIKIMTNLIKCFIILFLCSFNLCAQSQLNWKTLGNNHMIKGEFEKALDAYENYLQFYPQDVEVYLNRSRIHGVMGNENLAREDLQKAQTLNPYSRLFLDKAKRASKIMDQKYSYGSKDDETGFSKSPLKKKYYHKSIEEADLKASIENELFAILEHLHLGEFLIAEDKINSLDLTKNNKAIIYDMEGLLLLKLQRYDEAVAMFTKSIEADGNFAMPYHNRAICYQNLGEYELALSDIKFALSQENAISMFYFTLANIYESLDENENAIDAYQNALDRDEEYVEALLNSSVLMKELGNFSGSLELMNKVVSLDSNKPENYFQRGNLNFVYGEYQNAIEDFDVYLKKSQTFDQAALFNRGLAKILQGDSLSGCQDLNSSLKIENTDRKKSIYTNFCVGTMKK